MAKSLFSFAMCISVSQFDHRTRLSMSCEASAPARTPLALDVDGWNDQIDAKTHTAVLHQPREAARAAWAEDGPKVPHGEQ